jgi:Glycosyl transferase family 2
MTGSDAPLVSVLFVTYKRFKLLKQTVENFLRNTDYPRLELVVADDGSGPEIQEQIRTLPLDVLALAQRNRGLGANNNNGLRHCSGKYVLLLQDDWECMGPPDYLTNAVTVMEANPRVGIINFGGSPHPPDPAQRLAGSLEPCYVTPTPLDDGAKQHFLYTDNPHLRSIESVREIGFYKEDRDMEACEVDYEQRWQAQTKFLTAVFPAYHRQLFVHRGDDTSFRLGMFRNRVQAPLVPFAHWLKRRCKPLYHLGKISLLTSIRIIEKLR